MKSIKLKVNQIAFEVLIDEHECLAGVLREKIGLTGTKVGCEQGSCGACTVLVNDEPVLSCITPAIRCDNSEITTIEGVANNGELHLLQQKFIEKGAIQCGFCTPGMIMTSYNFIKKNHNASIDDIKEALSGNLCRCTGYKKIIEAVAETMSIESKTDNSENNYPKKNNIIGHKKPYIEAAKKVQGTAEYVDDIKIKNPLYCKFLRSTYPHAIIENIDISSAEKIDGVKYILTGKELTRKFGVLPISRDETALAIDKVRYIGEIVAAVAAESTEIAKEACRKIKVAYKPIRPFLMMDESLYDINENEKIHLDSKFKNNIHKIAELNFGDYKNELSKSEYTSKMDFEFEGLTHAFTEPHAAVAYWDENGLTIITATQVPHYLHRALSDVLEVPLSRVRVIKPYVGGGFGGKSDPFAHEIIVSHIARKTGRPVKVRFSREEVFINNHGRHPTKMTMEIGLNKDKELSALNADIVIDGGAYGSFGIVTSYYNGVLLQAPYKIDNLGFKTTRVFTNKPQCGAMRGHGAVNSRFAVESLIDDLAYQSKIDPCELRLKNFLDSNTITVGQYRITSNGSRESLLKVMEQSGWKDKYGKMPFGKGVGAGCGFFISGSALPIIRNELPQSVVHLKVDFDGRVVISSGSSDIGQGSDTMLAMVVAEVLGVSMDKIFVLPCDTITNPVDLGSYSSRVTFMAGNAAKMAAENLKKEITLSILKNKSISNKRLIFSEDKIHDEKNEISLTWNEAIDIALAGRGAISVSGHYISPKLGGNFKGAGAGLSPSYSFGAVIAEVDVDIKTGLLKVENIWGAHDCGIAINPLAVEGQLEGSWHMGMGQAVSEQLKYFKGLILNGNFLDYKIPTSLDIPEMHTNIIETNDPEGPFGAKECGEGAIHPIIPAIANAIFDAVGVRITKLPITPEEILLKMKKVSLIKEAEIES
ncbi:MAG: 4-hydroxybenzoyl-CoA reductase subunit alpha [Ignavibacteria bacterium]|nr:4-hydroxybenzoyl-CoA reductase subunit alpha [Ignavibacteria bacterium]